MIKVKSHMKRIISVCVVSLLIALLVIGCKNTSKSEESKDVTITEEANEDTEENKKETDSEKKESDQTKEEKKDKTDANESEKKETSVKEDDTKNTTSSTENKKTASSTETSEKKDTTTSKKDDNTTNSSTNTAKPSENSSSSNTNNSKPSGNSGSSSTNNSTTNSNTSSSKPSGSSSSSSTNNNSSSTTKPTHTHTWVAQTMTVHHEEVGHNEQYVVKAAWDETISEPIYEMKEYSICSVCGQDITGNTVAHGKAHALAGEGGGHYSEWKQVQTGTNTYTVHHDAEYGTRWVVDKAAYDETVTTGYKCACGATK